MNSTKTLMAAILLGALPAVPAAESAPVQDWPQFRGPNAAGIAENANPPIRFGPDTNLLWKVAVPAGRSSPIVSGDRIFLTAFESNQLVTLAYDRRTGHELWKRAAPAEKIENCHGFSSPAASTPCTDGQRVFAYFGSFGVLAYDFDGTEVWRRPFERLPIQYGTASSPILADGRLVLQRDGDSTNAQVIAMEPVVVNESGVFAVLRAGSQLDLAAVNKLEESVRSNPAIASDTLYVRNVGHLWAFGQKTQERDKMAKSP